MVSNNRIIRKELMDVTGRSSATVQRSITNLCNCGIVERRGSRKSGYWYVNR